MRFPFRAVPDASGIALRPRPILDVVVDGLDIAPQACLLDSGATAIRFGIHVADICGIDLTDAPATRLAAGGAVVEARMAEVGLTIRDEADAHTWSAPAWFCEPWTPAFGLLGLTGFFDHFTVTIVAYEEWIDVSPTTG